MLQLLCDTSSTLNLPNDVNICSSHLYRDTYTHLGVHTSDVRTPQRFTVLHHICSTIFPLILGVKVLHIYMYPFSYALETFMYP